MLWCMFFNAGLRIEVIGAQIIGESLFDIGKSGSEKIKENSSAKNKQRLMDMYGDHYRGEFQENHDQKVPRHPWKIFKAIREEIRETFEGEERHERVYVAEILFEEYKEKWEVYRSNVSPDDLDL